MISSVVFRICMMLKTSVKETKENVMCAYDKIKYEYGKRIMLVGGQRVLR